MTLIQDTDYCLCILNRHGVRTNYSLTSKDFEVKIKGSTYTFFTNKYWVDLNQKSFIGSDLYQGDNKIGTVTAITINNSRRSNYNYEITVETYD